jgi:hypothetical protein
LGWGRFGGKNAFTPPFSFYISNLSFFRKDVKEILGFFWDGKGDLCPVVPERRPVLGGFG